MYSHTIVLSGQVSENWDGVGLLSRIDHTNVSSVRPALACRLHTLIIVISPSAICGILVVKELVEGSSIGISILGGVKGNTIKGPLFFS